MAEKMKAVVYRDKHDVVFTDRDIPKVIDPRDAIVKVGMSSICTSDLHIMHGTVPKAKKGIILGHEFAGEVVEVGPAVKKIKPGDRVVSNVETFCGECFFCRRNFVNNCVEGGWELGCTIDGCQTEYVRVPLADNGLDILPEGADYMDYIMVSCILPSGYFGAKMLEIEPGDTIVVIGAGPTGLCTMICAQLFSPYRLIAVDVMDSRLEFAKKHGWADITINPKKEDVFEKVLELTDGRGADAVAEVAGGPDTFEMAWRLCRPNGIVGVVAMYPEAQVLPLPDMYGKNLTFKTGGVDAAYNQTLVNLIAAGKIDTRPILTHTRSLNDIMEAYKMFENHDDNCLKVAITPFER